MKKNSKNKIINFAAYGILFVGIILSAITLIMIIVLSTELEDANMAKIYLADIILFVAALVIFLVFMGIYEFLRSFIKLEEEIETLEGEVKEIENETAILENKKNHISNDTANKDSNV